MYWHILTTSAIQLFSDAGIKKSELKNPETSKFILETVAVAVMNKEAPSGTKKKIDFSIFQFF